MDEFMRLALLDKGQSIVYRLLIMAEADRLNIIDHDIYVEMIKKLVKQVINELT